MTTLLDYLGLLQGKCDKTVFREQVLPLVYNALESEHAVVRIHEFGIRMKLNGCDAFIGSGTCTARRPRSLRDDRLRRSPKCAFPSRRGTPHFCDASLFSLSHPLSSYSPRHGYPALK
jgi:hypothetical protein